MVSEDISGLVTRIDVLNWREIGGILFSRCILVKTQRGAYALLLSTP